MELRELRGKHNLSQGKLARKVDVSQATITMIENGKRNPSLPVAKRISAYFNVPMDDIFCKDSITLSD